MVEAINVAVGTGVIVLNIIPFIVKKPKYLLLTSIISLILLFLLVFMR